MRAARILSVFVVLVACRFAAATDRVSVQVLGLFHPRRLTVEPVAGHPLTVNMGDERRVLDSVHRPLVIRYADGRLICEGEAPESLTELRIFAQRGGDADFILSVPGKIRRRYHGQLVVQARGELIAVVSMDLETAVASVVAAELERDTPLEALKAQAVAARSYLAASAHRHRDAEFCDTTHCQFLRSPPDLHSPAARATAATAGLILKWQEKPFPARYSARCGGRTYSLRQTGREPEDYPYFSVNCPHCRRPGQRLTQTYKTVGLCQNGARGMAAHGQSFRAILAHYYPNATVASK